MMMNDSEASLSLLLAKYLIIAPNLGCIIQIETTVRYFPPRPFLPR